ncbi:MAG TPA: hypothetical protein VLD67_08225 [Vicinamibacterales bacterium]|nr:hypothetical protein [Vicinamibacterales bacterium]
MALALVWTWPLAYGLDSSVPHDLGDPLLVTWILWWNTQALPFSAAWWNAPIFHPLPFALALSDHLLGISALATPLQLAGGSPLFAHNVSLLLSYALSGSFAYLLALRLTNSRLAAACTGLAFGFSPYRAGQLSHLQVLTSQWMPVVLLGMHGYASTGRRGWLVLFGAAWLMQSLSNGYFMLFLPVLIFLWVAWFIDWRAAPRRAAWILAAWIVASLPLLPALLTYDEVHESLGLTRPVSDIRQFSAAPSSFLKPPPLLAFWPEGRSTTQEEYLFPGLTAIAVTVAALGAMTARGGLPAALKMRSPLVFYASATLVMWAFALGPGGGQSGLPSALRPYTWLLFLPGFDSLRVPARFAMLASLTLSIAAGLAVTHLMPRRRRWRAVAGAVLLAGLAADGWMESMPVVRRPARVLLPDVPDAVVVEIPTDQTSVATSAMYRAMLHDRPIVNGHSGHVPYHYQILSLSLARGDVSVLEYLARSRPLVIVVNERFDPGGGYRRMIGAIDRIERHGISAIGPVFLLRLPAAARAADAMSNRLQATSRSEPGERLVIDMGRGRTVTGLEFALRDRFPDLPERVLVEASDDGTGWREVWLDWTGALAMDAALADPLVTRIRIPLDVNAHYLRIHPAPAWLAAELTVVGH